MPEFRDGIDRLITLCSNSGLVVRLSSGLRTPLEQAALWRKGRAIEVIQQKICWLRDKDCDYLANCLLAVGPQDGEWVTNALPGDSWHNWGEAADFLCFDIKGSPINSGDDPVYEDFQRLIPLAGLNNYGPNWKKDAGHVQLRRNAPHQLYSLQDIDKVLEERYPL